MDARAQDLAVGVIGGLGPAATLDFVAKVLAATPATRDQEHLHLLIDNDPRVPDRNRAAAGAGPSPGPALAAMARRLERAGADLLVMPCNAAHAWRAEIEAATRLPFASMIDEAVAATLRARPGAATVGVLAAAGTLDAGLYRDALAARGVMGLEPAGPQRERFMDLLYRIKAGDTGAEARAAMRELAAELVAAGAEAVVAGCSEVPLVLGPEDVTAPLVDATAALAAATVAYARRERPLPVRPAGG